MPEGFHRLRLTVGLPGGAKSSQILGVESLGADLMFVGSRHRLRPHHAKLGFVLLVLQGDQAANFERLTQRSQTNTGCADVERVHDFGIGFSGIIVSRNPHRQHRFHATAAA